MAETTVLKVEVVGVTETNKDSLSPDKTGKKSSISAGSGLVADVVIDAEQDLISKPKMLVTEAKEDISFKQKAINKAKSLNKADFIKGTTGIISSGAAAYSLYSNYQKTGMELSGATHAAAVQGRKGNVATSAAALGGAALINPGLAALTIAMKAYQLSQTNRKELFNIQKEQLISTVLQRNLIKNVAERRF